MFGPMAASRVLQPVWPPALSEHRQCSREQLRAQLLDIMHQALQLLHHPPLEGRSCIGEQHRPAGIWSISGRLDAPHGSCCGWARGACPAPAADSRTLSCLPCQVATQPQDLHDSRSGNTALCIPASLTMLVQSTFHPSMSGRWLLHAPVPDQPAHRLCAVIDRCVRVMAGKWARVA